MSLGSEESDERAKASCCRASVRATFCEHAGQPPMGRRGDSRHARPALTVAVILGRLRVGGDEGCLRVDGD
jgi:hypothetical protein